MRRSTRSHPRPRSHVHQRGRVQARGSSSAKAGSAAPGGSAATVAPPRLALLGPFELCRQSGVPARLPKKAQALLAYLATRPGHLVPREHLAALLWGDRGPEQARRSLRQSLMSVRAALRPFAHDVIVSDGAQIALSETVRVDVAEFERLAQSSERADLEAAERLCRDEFLSGLLIPSEPFNEWLIVERQRYAGLISAALFRLATLRAREGEVERGIEVAERLIRFDPLREDGHRLLIQLLFTAGRRSAALTQYERCVEVLRRDLSVAPERETVQLADRIRSGCLPTSIEAVSVQTGSGTEAVSLDSDRSDRDSKGSIREIAQKTSILVLGFANLSGDPEQDYFAQGVAQEITIALGRVPWLFVLAGTSVARRDDCGGAHGNRSALDARYVLQGSVRRAGSRVRIVVEILDTASRGQIWCDSFEGDLDDIFEIQDSVATQAVGAIAPRLHLLEVQRAQRKATDNLGAYDLYLRAVPKFRKSAIENAQALHLLQQATALDRSYGVAYALAARCYHFQKVMGWAHPADPRLEEGVRLARRAEEFGGEDSEALWMTGLALVFLSGDLDHGERLIEKSLLLNPNSVNAWIASCFARTFLGDTETAMEHFVHAQRINPLDMAQHVRWNAAGNIHFIAGRYREAAEVANRTLSEIPTYPPGLRMKIAACGMLGRLDEAREAVALLSKVNPGASIAAMRLYWEPLLRRNHGALDRYVEGLRRAGLRDQ